MKQHFGMGNDEFMQLLMRSMSGAQAAVYDLVIVGGGPGGTYTAYRAHKEFPDRTVCLFEKTDRIGGRLYSVDHHNKVREELGGMRIFPSVMKNLVGLVNECGLTLVPVPLTDSHNIFYYKGKRYEKGKFKINGRTVGEVAAQCVANWKAAYPIEAAADPYL